MFISRRRCTPSLHPQKTCPYKTSVYAFAHFTGTESTYYVQHLMRSFQLYCFIYFRKGVFFGPFQYMTRVKLIKILNQLWRNAKKISYILEVCIPCSPLSFKGVYKILAINFQSGHNLHRFLEPVLLKLHFYYYLFSCTLLWTSIFKFE